MASVTVTSPSAKIKADAVVVGVHSSGDGPVLAAGAEPIDEMLGGRLLGALTALRASGRPDEVLTLPTFGLCDVDVVVATGLGSGPITDDSARRAAGAALRTLSARRRVHLAIDAAPAALAEGALLGAYQYLDYKPSATAPALRTITLTGPAAARAQVKRATVIAQAVTLVRDLVNMPPNHLYPQSFADRAAELARERGLTVEVLDEKGLRKGKYGGILGVGAGSARPPRLVRISYRPAGARMHLALVGKGITFDSGGINLKTAALTWMKSDMGGAAAMIASVLAVADLGLKVDVTATVPMAENMPSATSYRPSDILTMYDGSTVEVGDTDAEGRLVLADAITRAAEDSPDYLIEASTLTGAQLVALGAKVIGAMGEDAWRDEVVAAGAAVGEAAWAMPLPDDLRARLDSPVADMNNVTSERWGGMLVAGRFLGEFVPEGLPWVHLDIAGPAYNNGAPHGFTPKGGTGAGVRTVIEVAQRLAAR